MPSNGGPLIVIDDPGCAAVQVASLRTAAVAYIPYIAA